MIQFILISSTWIFDFKIILITGILVILSILIPEYLSKHNKISKFAARKIIHSFSGLAVLITPYLNYPLLAGILSLIMTLITRTSGRKSPIKIQRHLYEAIKEDEEEKIGYLQGPFAYCLSITILVFIFIPFKDKYYFPITAIFIMMYADTVAAYIGRKFGNHIINIPWTENKRTVEGSLSFLFTSLIISFSTFLLLGKTFPGFSTVLTKNEIIIFSITISIFSTILELFSPSKFDDLIIPLGSSLFISLLAVIMGIW